MLFAFIIFRCLGFLLVCRIDWGICFAGSDTIAFCHCLWMVFKPIIAFNFMDDFDLMSKWISNSNGSTIIVTQVTLKENNWG